MNKIYTKSNCVQCTATKKVFDSEGISYVLVDVSKDSSAMDYLLGLGYKQVPVVETPSMTWSGFRPDLIKELK